MRLDSFLVYFSFSLETLNAKLLWCREMEEIMAFVKGAICDDRCLGRCLYIHGVPGTGKVSSVALLNTIFSSYFKYADIICC